MSTKREKMIVNIINDLKLFNVGDNDVTIVEFLLRKAAIKKMPKSIVRRNYDVDQLICSLFLSGDL